MNQINPVVVLSLTNEECDVVQAALTLLYLNHPEKDGKIVESCKEIASYINRNQMAMIAKHGIIH